MKLHVHCDNSYPPKRFKPSKYQIVTEIPCLKENLNTGDKILVEKKNLWYFELVNTIGYPKFNTFQIVSFRVKNGKLINMKISTLKSRCSTGKSAISLFLFLGFHWTLQSPLRVYKKYNSDRKEVPQIRNNGIITETYILNKNCFQDHTFIFLCLLIKTFLKFNSEHIMML